MAKIFIELDMDIDLDQSEEEERSEIIEYLMDLIRDETLHYTIEKKNILKVSEGR